MKHSKITAVNTRIKVVNWIEAFVRPYGPQMLTSVLDNSIDRFRISSRYSLWLSKIRVHKISFEGEGNSMSLLGKIF